MDFAFAGYELNALIELALRSPETGGFLSLAGTLGLLVVMVRMFRRAHWIEDLPTSTLRGAAQGYAEFSGRGTALKDMPLFSPLSGLACLWYRYRIEKRVTHRTSHGVRGTWETLTKAESDRAFLLEDNAGQCLVHPAGAEITPHYREIWHGGVPHPGGKPSIPKRWMVSIGDYRYTEELILPAENLYVLGWFESLQPGPTLETEFRESLARLKTSREELLHRFDRDRDGTISAEEWDEAREAVKMELLRARAEKPAEESIQTLTVPADRSLPFLISTISQASLLRRYQLWGWCSLGGALILLYIALRVLL